MALSSEMMDEELREAALNGSVKFLKKCVKSNKPVEYYMSYHPRSSNDEADRRYGNIFHMAAYNNKEEFIKKAIQILPVENTQQLLLQPREPSNGNPLHVSADPGNVKITKIFLDVYRSLPSLPSDIELRPWLMQNNEGDTPCYVAIGNNHEECALEILKIDMECICNTPDNRGSYIIFDAIYNKLTKLALEILRSPFSISCTGYGGRSPFIAIHVLNSSEEAEEIFRLLLERDLDLIKQIDEDGFSVFYHWVRYGNKTWPFKRLLKCHDIIPKSVFVDMVFLTNNYGDNLLHNLAEYTSNEEVAIEIAKLLINTYKEEPSNIDVHPWLVVDNDGDTPLSLAINRQFENFAIYILSLDANTVIKIRKNLLFLAVEKECHQVAEKILEIIENQGWAHLLNSYHKNVLHIAPFCKQEFFTRLVEGHPELLNEIDKGGITILRNWVKNGEVWLFQYILESKWRSTFVKLLKEIDYNKWNNPFHDAASTTNNEATIQIVKLLVEAYKEEFPNWDAYATSQLPWFVKNKAEEGPLHIAISNKNEKLASYILSLLDEDDDISELLDYYKPEHRTLFLAILNDCQQVTEFIMSRLDKEGWTKYLKDFSDGRNILHLAPTLTNVKFGKWLVNVAPEFITQKDNNNQSSWDKAYEIGPSWFIKAVLEKDPSVFNSAPLVWTKACEKGHVDALKAFIEHNPGAFRDLCVKYKDSPLHHIKLHTLTEYENFLQIPHMKDLINIQNVKNETPLHKAIRNGDIFLTETLLKMEKIIYDINDINDVTAMDLLAHVHKEDNATWGHMCKRNGLDPTIKTTYFKHKTNLLDVRTSLFLVAALLATITFTAGFTLPGGFNQETGEALLGKKASFLVFLVSDTLALFFSMLVLICLTWSMVFEPSKSLILVDRSMVLLRVALNCTLLAFMTGVYIVMAPMSLWVAILIIVVISSLIIISVDKTFLYEVLDKLFLIASKESKDPMQLAELGYNFKNE
ncbi:uncharacterized protein LOC110723931 [Chenopodium quinoa]|uniref:uncharacterized protein LOC110723931 n=1 Tax=Chenopodium quinoa TaxID=63459 RepID=UPI000B7891D9|nr:uncharacterized protein LOC110723931 [Chenopodium quinoa]